MKVAVYSSGLLLDNRVVISMETGFRKTLQGSLGIIMRSYGAHQNASEAPSPFLDSRSLLERIEAPVIFL